MKRRLDNGKIFVLAVGLTSDIEPLHSVALELQSRNYATALCTHQAYIDRYRQKLAALEHKQRKRSRQQRDQAIQLYQSQENEENEDQNQEHEEDDEGDDNDEKQRIREGEEHDNQENVEIDHQENEENEENEESQNDDDDDEKTIDDEIEKRRVRGRRREVALYGLKGDPLATVQGDQFQRLVCSKETGDDDERAMFELLLSSVDRYVASNYRRVWNAAQTFGANAIVCGVGCAAEALVVAQRLQIPIYVVALAPFAASAQVRPVASFGSGTGGEVATGQVAADSVGAFDALANRMRHWAARRAAWNVFGERVNEFRRALGVFEVDEFDVEGLPQLCLFAEAVQPRPADWPASTVSVLNFALGDVAVTSLRLTEQQDVADRATTTSIGDGDGSDGDEMSWYVPPRKLRAFMDADERPLIFASFGDMPLRGAADMLLVLDSVLAHMALRAVYVSSDGRQVASPDAERVLVLREHVPAQWLVPQCVVAIHHASAELTATCMRAGVPMVPFPIVGEQFYWASRVAALGVGPPHVVPASRCFDRALVERHIAFSLSDQAHQAATALRDRLAALDDGASLVADDIAQHFAEHRNRSAITMQWRDDDDCARCLACDVAFSLFTRRSHCRSCGSIFCKQCCRHWVSLPSLPGGPHRVCGSCLQTRALAADSIGGAASTTMAAAAAGSAAATSAEASSSSAAATSPFSSSLESFPQIDED
jgi:FYVE zinc finger